MVNLPVNATGWSYLMDTEVIKAVYTMFDVALGSDGWVVIILFFLYQFMLFMKTFNMSLMFFIGILFLTIYRLSDFYQSFAGKIILSLLVIEISIMVIIMLWNKNK